MIYHQNYVLAQVFVSSKGQTDINLILLYIFCRVIYSLYPKVGSINRWDKILPQPMIYGENFRMNIFCLTFPFCLYYGRSNFVRYSLRTFLYCKNSFMVRYMKYGFNTVCFNVHNWGTFQYYILIHRFAYINNE